jgi:hypothetical protein
VHRPPEALGAPDVLRAGSAGLPGRPLLRRLAFAAGGAVFAVAIVLSFLLTGM